ncbi:hypothetical protein EB796_006850 [Bugula neritina]|uniref:Uncharacterized protein n=1 Tax=Bugula neritina TaxID=10212 RepID=A0A7J7KA75_BUGNE|nr:hypothetical protein EB796_006850 [Bugula neritina]
MTPTVKTTAARYATTMATNVIPKTTDIGTEKEASTSYKTASQNVNNLFMILMGGININTHNDNILIEQPKSYKSEIAQTSDKTGE